MGWNLGEGHLFPQMQEGFPDGQRRALPFTAPQMTAALQAHLREASLPSHFTMHPLRVGGSLSKSLAGTPVDEIMQLRGWKTEAMAKHYIGATSSGAVVNVGQTVDQLYDHVNAWSASSDFQSRYAACGRRFLFGQVGLGEVCLSRDCKTKRRKFGESSRYPEQEPSTKSNAFIK